MSAKLYEPCALCHGTGRKWGRTGNLYHPDQMGHVACAGCKGEKFVEIGLTAGHAELAEALDESVRLQSHYARLLNQYDGGERRGFESGEEWIARLRELKVLTLVNVDE